MQINALLYVYTFKDLIIKFETYMIPFRDKEQILKGWREEGTINTIH